MVQLICCMPMDVFIPEEYVVRRRMERKAAAALGNRSEAAQESSGRRVGEKEKKARSPSFRPVEKNEFLANGGQGESIIFSCFSA